MFVLRFEQVTGRVRIIIRIESARVSCDVILSSSGNVMLLSDTHSEKRWLRRVLLTESACRPFVRRRFKENVLCASTVNEKLVGFSANGEQSFTFSTQ